MTSWHRTKGEFEGSSKAADWPHAVIDMESMLDKLLEECIAAEAIAAYIEMWPDSGRFICYPAAQPVQGSLADRETAFLVQLRLAFWRDTWDQIGESSTSDVEYLRLRDDATSALQQALTLSIAAAKLKARRPDFLIYVFEYEGTENVMKLGLDGVERN